MAEAYPNSSGTGRPSAAVPTGACDAHIHVVDPRFPLAGPTDLAGATLADYQRIQARLGTTRAVLVQAKLHGTNHDALLDALADLGPDGRGIAVVGPDVPDAELARLDSGGVRGLRFSLWKASDALVTIDMLEPLARRIADLGWHAQIHMNADQIVEAAALLARLPCPIVFDHMGRLPPARGPDHPAFRVIAGRVEAGRAWVKLSGAYLDTETGPPDYADVTRTARAYVRLAPERVVWGSDWPHVTEPRKPDDARLLDLARAWAGDAVTFAALMTTNAEGLYGFAPAPSADGPSPGDPGAS